MESVQMLPANVKLLSSFKSYSDGARHNEYLCDELMHIKNLYSGSNIRLDIELPGSDVWGSGVTYPVIMGSSDGSALGYMFRETMLQNYTRPRGYDFFEIDSGGKLEVGIRKSKPGNNNYSHHRWLAPFQRLRVNGRSSKYPGPGEGRTRNDFVIPLNRETDRKLILNTLYDSNENFEMEFLYKDKTAEPQKILGLRFEDRVWKGIDWTEFDAEEDRKTLEYIAAMSKK